MSTKVKKHPPLGDRVGWGEEKIDLHQASLEISPSNTKENKTMTVVLTKTKEDADESFFVGSPRECAEPGCGNFRARKNCASSP